MARLHPPVMVKQAAHRAKGQARHGFLIASFLALVALPTCASVWYLYTLAEDQYAANLGFSVRQENTTPPPQVDLFGGVGNYAPQMSQDSDVLFEYIQSPDMVAAIDARLDLHRLFSKPAKDPVFSLASDASPEALHRYWGRMVKVSYDPRTQLINLYVKAFDSGDAKEIAEAIREESSALINALSAIAQEDAIRYAREQRDMAEARLQDAREALKHFRSRHQIIDPAADLDGQIGLLTSLQAQKAQALIDLGLAREGDPRIDEIHRRIDVISRTIAQERRNIGGQSDDVTYAVLMQEYDNLVVDQGFAEESYTAALANYDAAVQEAGRQSRYLATYIRPIQATEARFPRRLLCTGLIAGFGLLIWAILTLVFYSLRDRR